MSENMEKFRHIDGSEAVAESDHYKIEFQHGHPSVVGINGCLLQEVIETLEDHLTEFQARELACEENTIALAHLRQAREALDLRRRRREEQNVLGTPDKHRADASVGR